MHSSLHPDRKRIAQAALAACVSLLATACGNELTTSQSGGPGGGPATPLTPLPDEPFTASGLHGSLPAPIRKSYTVYNFGANEAAFVAAGLDAWVTVQPSAGVVPARGLLELTVSFDEALVLQLAEGQHHSELRLNDPDSGDILGAIEVALRIDPTNQGHSMNRLPPTGLSASGVVGGPFEPAAQSYTWTNNGSGPLEYVRTVSESWISVSGPAQGFVVPREVLRFDVALGQTELAGFELASIERASASPRCRNQVARST